MPSSVEGVEDWFLEAIELEFGFKSLLPVQEQVVPYITRALRSQFSLDTCISAPTGSGKTRLVHAVAEQSECVVIEINSSAVRSGSALKKAIQETTQSHSNLAMSKKKKTGGGGGNALFGKKTAVEESDDENGRFFDESSDEEESVRESHSLTVILIDEGESCTIYFH